MPELKNTNLSKAIINAHHGKLLDRIAGDVLIVGFGPSWFADVSLEENDLNAEGFSLH